MAENIKEVKAHIKKSKEQENKYLTFYNGGTSEYLESIKNLPVAKLIMKPFDKLKYLAKELGCKRLKDADSRYYAHVLYERMQYLKEQSKKVNNKTANSKKSIAA